jgi:hypothetical protein
MSLFDSAMSPVRFRVMGFGVLVWEFLESFPFNSNFGNLFISSSSLINLSPQFQSQRVLRQAIHWYTFRFVFFELLSFSVSHSFNNSMPLFPASASLMISSLDCSSFRQGFLMSDHQATLSIFCTIFASPSGRENRCVGSLCRTFRRIKLC